MVSKRKKKYTSGEGAQYISRTAALKMLQLTLKNFRKLCILKGIYPREPHSRKRAQKGATGIKTLYYKKDIQFLMHEPIIWKIRDQKTFVKKIARAKGMKDFKAFKRTLKNRPSYALDHIVKERYPTFIDAVRGLDDCLTLCFLFSTFPSFRHIPKDQSALCRTLTVEFMHFVIAAKALRKVFVSIKGYYFQAEIKGQTVTWIVPHHFSFAPPSKHDVDFQVMSIFVEFYTILLGFVNFRLYHSLNLYYPPVLSSYSVQHAENMLVDEKIYVSERIAALNLTLSHTGAEPEEEPESSVDLFPTANDPEQLQKAKEEMQNVTTLKTLFKGLKFFVNREVPREPIVFVIRCFGGDVSWDKLHFVGATFAEDDESITHHIVDRPSIDKQYISRDYIQPQWVFDSVNVRQLLPVEKYFLGATLPPHLSPFIDETREHYIPPEEKALKDPSLVETADAEESESSGDEVEKSDDEHDNTDDDSNQEVDNTVNCGQEDGTKEIEKKMSRKDAKKLREQEEKKKKMRVSAGKVFKEDPMAKSLQERQEYKLREKMIKKKHRNLYKSMMEGRRKRSHERWLLAKKRTRLDASKKSEEKAAKKHHKVAAVNNTAVD